MQNKKKLVKQEKGAISTLVLFTVLVFLAILMGSYLITTTLLKSQLKSNMRIAQIYGEDVDNVDEIYNEKINASWNEIKKVNAPKIKGTGLTPVKIDANGNITVTTEEDTTWYNYENQQWANAKSADGSLWVWIPRYAYKITYEPSNDHSQAGTIDVKFLIGTTDNYEEANTETGSKAAKRATEKNVGEAGTPVDTTTDYYVHPAFTNESSIQFANGGWDKELTGIWVAKFEAGYVGNYNVPTSAKDSNVSYTSTDDVTNYYGKVTTSTKMKYPTFQANKASYNNINVSDAFTLCRHLTDEGNQYGLTSTVDSHLMKNSEWGAVTYLAWSKYGQNKKQIRINNVSANGTNTVYAVTGYGAATDDEGENKNLNLSDLLNGSAQGNWHSDAGKKASTTGNITGIYDMSGGSWERTASFVDNGNTNLVNNAKSLLEEAKTTITSENKANANTGHSTKYVTIYPNDENTSTNNSNTASQSNFAKNTKIFGDAIRETTGSKAGSNSSGWNTNAWNSDYSRFAGYTTPVFLRGGIYDFNSKVGNFAFHCTTSKANTGDGFRAVLIP